MRRILAGALTGLLLLSGCADRREVATLPPSTEAMPAPADADSEPAGPEEPLPVPTRKPETAAKRTDLDPERLIGLSTFQTESLLGTPALQDERPPAKVWTYNAETCVLSIFFYPDINTRVFQALTYEFNAEVKTDEAKRRCLEELVREHAG